MAKPADYHDALHVKLNTVVTFLVEIFGGFSRPAARHLDWLAARAKRRDTTVYESWAAPSFLSHWVQRLSIALAGGDARRALTALERLHLSAPPAT